MQASRQSEERKEKEEERFVHHGGFRTEDYPHREGTIHGIRTLIVQSDRGVHGVAVDHGRQTRIGGESERIVDTARKAASHERRRDRRGTFQPKVI